MDGSAFSADVATFGDLEPIRTAFPARLADVLRPACRALPLVGRKAELETLLAWMESEAGDVRVVVGPAGVGKSRLLAEIATLTGRRFLATDGVQVRDAAADGAKQIIMSRHMRAAASGAELLVISPLTAVERAELFDAAYRAGASHFGRPFQSVRLAQFPDGMPEDVIMAGLIAPDIGVQAAVTMPPEDRAARIAAREANLLDAAAWRAGVDPWLVRHIAACITHRGGASVEEAVRMVQREAEAGLLHLHCAPEHLVDVLADLLQEEEQLRPVAEGAVGRAFVRQVLACHDERTRAAILARAARLPDCFAGSTLDGITVTDSDASCHFALESPA